jgi:ribosomal subunit interface protein
MQIRITSRHGEVPVALKLRAESVVKRLARMAHRPTRAQVTFDTEHQRAAVELVLWAARGAVLVARAEASEHRTALDRVAQKLRRQLDKRPTPRRRAAAGRR